VTLVAGARGYAPGDLCGRPGHAKCMSVKTITIDIDAYERLSRLKRGGKSFSQVIKEHFPPAASTAGELLEALEMLRHNAIQNGTLGTSWPVGNSHLNQEHFEVVNL